MDEHSHKDPRAKGQQSRLLDDFGDFKLWVMGYDRLPEFTEFIYRVYYETRSKKYNWQPTTNVLERRKFDLNASIRIFDILLRGLNEDFEDPNAYLGVAEMENLVLRYHRRIGVPWQVIGEPRTYWGNTKFPCAFRLQEYEANLRENHPERYAFVYQK